MKPNYEQQEYIKDKLLGRYKCRETYEELYDHVLTALDTLSDDTPFLEAVNNIIENDLGGAKAIRSIERKYLKIAIKEYIGDYFSCIGQMLKSYLILVITVFTIIYYLLMQHEWFNAVIGQAIPLFICLVPAVIIGRKTTNTISKAPVKTFKMDYLKKTIRPFGNIFMLFFPFWLWMLTSDMCKHLQRVKIMSKQEDYYGLPINIAAILFFIILIHAVAYYKLYKDWDKIIMASYL